MLPAFPVPVKELETHFMQAVELRLDAVAGKVEAFLQQQESLKLQLAENSRRDAESAQSDASSLGTQMRFLEARLEHIECASTDDLDAKLEWFLAKAALPVLEETEGRSLTQMEHGEGESAAKELETRLVALIEATVAARLVPFERMSTLVDAHVQMAENSRREAGQMADDAKKLETRLFEQLEAAARKLETHLVAQVEPIREQLTEKIETWSHWSTESLKQMTLAELRQEAAAGQLETRLVALIESTVAARLVPSERKMTFADAHMQLVDTDNLSVSLGLPSATMPARADERSRRGHIDSFGEVRGGDREPHPDPDEPCLRCCPFCQGTGMTLFGPCVKGCKGSQVNGLEAASEAAQPMATKTKAT